MSTEKRSVSVDENLGIEERVSALDTLGEAQNYRDLFLPTECHDWTQLATIRANSDALGHVLCQRANLFQRGITFRKVLLLLELGAARFLEICLPGTLGRRFLEIQANLRSLRPSQ